VTPRVFVSSVYREWFDGELQFLPLRDDIVDAGRNLPIELCAIDGGAISDEGPHAVPADHILDLCFAGVETCDLFVLLLTKRPGSGVRYLPDRTAATYTEMEIFAADLLHKPFLVLHETGRELEGPMAEVVRLLKPTLSPEDYVVGAAPELVAAFRTACLRMASKPRRRRRRRLPDGLSRLRTLGSAEADLDNPRLLFLEGRLGAMRHSPDLGRAAILLAQVRTGLAPRAAGGEAPMSHGAALFRLWAAMRELMHEGEAAWRDPDLAPLWDEALGLWAAKASWFGLHGHIVLGPLAALNLQLAVRRGRPAGLGAPVREPHGARASAIYSIAGVVGSPFRKAYHYKQALIAADRALSIDPAARQGTLSIKGHVLMRRAMLGYVPEIFPAVAALEESLAIRVRSSASAAAVGEAMADLGFCLILALQPFRGVDLLKEGVALLRQDPSPSGLSFLARGLRKLEQGQRLTLQLSAARETHAEREAIARAINAFDQVRG
jgi:hypothetical protein